MKFISSLVSILFWAILSTDCLLVFNRLDEYRFYSKPLLMPALYLFMALETADTSHRRSKAIISLALLFAMGGDILLLYTNEKIYFTTGLLCFFMVRIFYTVFFLRVKHFSSKKVIPVVIALGAIIVFEVILVGTLWQRINEAGFGLQVVAYSVSTALMVTGAVYATTGKRAAKAAWKYFVPGAVVFVFSDALLAVSKFYPFINPPRDLLAGLNSAVMLTYGCAQLLLVTGAIKFIKR